MVHHLALALILALMFLNPAYAQSRNPTSSPSPSVRETVHIQSTALREIRSVFVMKPAGYANESDRYPVMYLLDAEEHLKYTAEVIRYLAESDRIPNLIVVGIPSGGSKKRAHDLTTPSKSDLDKRFTPNNGGAGQFLKLLCDELIPEYRTKISNSAL